MGLVIPFHCDYLGFVLIDPVFINQLMRIVQEIKSFHKS